MRVIMPQLQLVWHNIRVPIGFGAACIRFMSRRGPLMSVVFFGTP